MSFEKLIREEGLRGLTQLLTDFNQVKTLEAPPQSILVSPDGTINPALTVTNAGDIGIGTTGPDCKLDVLDITGPQLCLTFEDGVKFVSFKLDTNHDLTITPSSTGQIKLQPTTDSTDFFQVLDADGGPPVLNVDSTNERVGIGVATPATKLDVVRADASGTVLRLENSAGVATASFINSASKEWNFGVLSGASGSFAITEVGVASQFFVEAGGNVGIGISNPAAKLHVDQSSTTAAEPVLSLDQADLSEEFIDFITTVGAGNPIDTAAVGTYYGKARVAVNGTFKYVALYNT